MDDKNKKSKKSTRLVVWAVVLGVLAVVFGYLDTIKERFYVFDQNVLQRVAQEALAMNHTNTHDLAVAVAQKLHDIYPDHINLKEEWVFNNAGGAMGAMWLLHTSITEYVIIFGTAVGTEGHSGRFLADDYFIILDGEQWAFYPGDLDRKVFKAGDMHHMPRGYSQQYKMPEKCFALEYARGWIPPMLPFGIFDTLFSTLDFYTLYHTFRLYGTLAIKELLQGKF